MQSEKPILIIAAFLIAMLLIGELIVYVAPEEYSIGATRTSDGLEWNISSTGSNTYNILVLDNGTALSQKTVYFYLDETYGHTSSPGRQPVGSKTLDPEHYLDLLEKELKYKGVNSVVYVNAEALAETLSDCNDSAETALVMVSGSIPDTVYGEVSLLTDWIHSGGTLYWAGGIIGEYVSHRDGTVDQISDGPQRILGSDCINPLRADSDPNAGLVDGIVSDNQLKEAIGLKNNSVLYAVDPGHLAESVGHLSLGFTDGTYTSITYVQSGMGQVCVVGGDLTHDQNSDMSQVLASGLCYKSSVIAIEVGKVLDKKISGEIKFTATGNIRAYIFLGHGAEYPVYGRGFDL